VRARQAAAAAEAEAGAEQHIEEAEEKNEKI